MKRIATAGLVVVSALGALAIAASGSGKRGADVIRADAEVVARQGVDNPPAGESMGDAEAFTQRLTRRGEPLGQLRGTCVLVEPPAGFQCRAIADLGKGSLVLAANLGERRSTGAITGGTGRYRRAAGTVTVEPVAEGRERITFRVLR